MINPIPDSLIFDMDGTLWDAVDSYSKIWNITSDSFGISRRVSRADLLDGMGQTLDRIIDKVFGRDFPLKEAYLKLLRENEARLTAEFGGTLYPGVSEGIRLLAGKHKLMMVSNCGADGLKNFLRFTGLGPFISDTLTNGETGLDKADNIKLIMKRNGITDAVYIGDTAHDCVSAHKAGIPMVYAAYGFGHCDDAEYTITGFPELLKLLNL